MHSASYIGLAVPATLIIFSSCIALVYSLATHYDQFERYYLTALVSQFAIFAFRITAVSRKSARYTIAETKTGRRLPESPAANFEDKFFVHIAEEAVKFLVLAVCATWIASGSDTQLSYVLVVATVFAGNKLVCNLMTFSPLNYSTHYKKFSRALRNFEGKSCVDTGSGVKSGKLSVASSPSLNASETATLVSSSSDEVAGPRFKLDLFDDSEGSGTKPQRGIAIHESMESLTAAYSQRVERLLSISPGDTAHLDCNPFWGPSEVVSGRNTTDSEGQNMDESPDLEPQTPLLRRPSTCNSPQKSHCSARILSRRSTLSLATQKSAPRPSKWAWIFPWCNQKEKKRPSVRKSRKAERAQIRKKLSTFTLNSDVASPYEKSGSSGREGETTSLKSAKSWYSYGAVDLESQAPDMAQMACNSHTYYEFARFANVYLDVWAPSLHGVLRQVDPAFVRFGVPISRLPAVLFVLHEASVCMWQTTSTLVLASPFLGTFPSVVSGGVLGALVVAKLFCANYVHGQSAMPYKHAIGAEFLVNVALCAGAYAFIYIFTS